MASWPGEEDVCVQAGKVPGDVCIQGKVPVLFCGGWGAAMGSELHCRQYIGVGCVFFPVVVSHCSVHLPFPRLAVS